MLSAASQQSNALVLFQVSGFFFRVGKMVKLGNNFSEKNTGKVVSEDGFDTIPLITPLDASQLQFPPPDKVTFFGLFDISLLESHSFIWLQIFLSFQLPH